MANRRDRGLRVLDETFVPDERKVEVRKRLARLKGQIEGVERMLGENRPCAELLTQISAVCTANASVTCLRTVTLACRCSIRLNVSFWAR